MTASAITHLVDAIGELATNNPYVNAGLWTSAGEPFTLAITSPEGDAHRVPVHTHDLETMAAAVRAGREDFDRSHSGHPREGLCAFCDPAPVSGPQAHNPLAGLIDALGELATNYPMDEGPSIRITLTDTDGTPHPVSLDPVQVDHVARLIDYARNQTEHDYYQDPACAWCDIETIEEDTPVIL